MKMEEDLLEIVRPDALLFPVLFRMAADQSKLGGCIALQFCSYLKWFVFAYAVTFEMVTGFRLASAMAHFI